MDPYQADPQVWRSSLGINDDDGKRPFSLARTGYCRHRRLGIPGAEPTRRPAVFRDIALNSPQRGLRRGRSMRIVVDLNRCLGYAQCVPLAPDVLQLQGEEALGYDPNPDDSQRQRVARAVASCPVQAIIAEMDPPSDRSTK